MIFVSSVLLVRTDTSLVQPEGFEPPDLPVRSQNNRHFLQIAKVLKNQQKNMKTLKLKDLKS